MTPTSEERDTRIPYRLGTDHYCTYEDEGEESYVRMGDMIWHVYDTPYGEVELDGELCSVRYGEDGFIDAVSVYVEGEEMNFDCPCDGVFYRMKGEQKASVTSFSGFSEKTASVAEGGGTDGSTD